MLDAPAYSGRLVSRINQLQVKVPLGANVRVEEWQTRNIEGVVTVRSIVGSSPTPDTDKEHGLVVQRQETYVLET